MSRRDLQPRVLLIGGIDPSAGAGLSADVRIAQALEAQVLLVPVCLTVQNRHGLRELNEVAPDLVRRMLDAALGDGPVHAVKIGLLGSETAVRGLREPLAALRRDGVPIVVDPVLGATAGGWNASPELVELLAAELAPLARVLTPNLPELARLAPPGPEAVLARGCGAVLVKGGHAAADVVEDVLWTDRERVVFRHPRLDRGPVRGTGCALATALACGLARGRPLETACRAAIDHVTRCLAATPRSADAQPTPLVVVPPAGEAGPGP